MPRPSKEECRFAHSRFIGMVNRMTTTQVGEFAREINAVSSFLERAERALPSSKAIKAEAQRRKAKSSK